jgi:hypothetical protein
MRPRRDVPETERLRLLHGGGEAMLDTGVLESTRHDDAKDLDVDLNLLEVMLDLDPGMLVWDPQTSQ